ncbi:MAG TPA: NAD(P)/FAD-dependent oxidoreductase [Thermoplasmata archaeon]|nr:NAD(P)/FAD-dependent oxidoreductase [Thermoplasmata archaeon]HIH98625.1 NAD(P)/FAD-dependent oxidoreductase [Thermoplasmata archaeon]
MMFDVCIVGTGPGGLQSAVLLSERGVRPLVLEKRKRVTDSFCGELVGKKVLTLAKIPESSELVTNRILRTTVINLDTGHSIDIPEKTTGDAYLLDENKFQTYLKDVAESNGAEFRFAERASSVIKRDGFVRGIRTTRVAYNTPITIGADGARSTVASTSHFPLSDFKTMPSFRFKLENCKGLDVSCAHFYLSKKIGLGYLWLYPRSERECNVGIGSPFPNQMGLILRKFIDKKAEFASAKIIDRNGDRIPYTGLLPKFVDNGVALVGNSAGQVSNLLGGGVETTLTGATLASRVVMNALESQDYSARQLASYEKEYKRNYAGKKVQTSAKHLSGIIEFSKKRDVFGYLDEIFSIVSVAKITKTVYGEFSIFFILSLMVKHPKFVLKLLIDYYL